MYEKNGSAMNEELQKGNCIVAMPSMTYAMQGETLLRQARIPVRLIKLPAGATGKGCAYGLSVPRRYMMNAVDLLDAGGVRRGELLS